MDFSKKLLDFITSGDYLEDIVLWIIIIFNCVLRIPIEFVLALTLIFLAFLFFRKKFPQIFILKLFKARKEDKLYGFMGVFNLLLMLLMPSIAKGLALFFYLLFIKGIFLFEKYYIRNRILTRAIDEVSMYGKILNYSSLMTDDIKEYIDKFTIIEEYFQEVSMEKMNSELLKMELITNITHDIKTPLTSIINYTDFLSRKSVMDDEAREYIKVLGRNSTRLKSLIVDLIEASKTATGNVKVEKGFIEFNELFLQTYGNFDGLFQEKSLELIFNSSHENIVIYSDGELIFRAIENLLSNVVKYAKPDTRVYADAVLSNDELNFCIKNLSEKRLNISVDELQNTFTKNDNSRSTEGSGLGLYITKNLVEILGGDFNIKIDGDYFSAFITLKIE